MIDFVTHRPYSEDYERFVRHLSREREDTRLWDLAKSRIKRLPKGKMIIVPITPWGSDSWARRKFMEGFNDD